MGTFLSLGFLFETCECAQRSAQLSHVFGSVFDSFAALFAADFVGIVGGEFATFDCKVRDEDVSFGVVQDDLVGAVCAKDLGPETDTWCQFNGNWEGTKFFGQAKVCLCESPLFGFVSEVVFFEQREHFLFGFLPCDFTTLPLFAFVATLFAFVATLFGVGLAISFADRAFGFTHSFAGFFHRTKSCAFGHFLVLFACPNRRVTWDEKDKR